MKNLFIISEDERKRILGLHENATKRQYLNEEYFNRQVRFWEPLSQTAKDIIKSICDVRTIEGEDYFTIGELSNANEDNFVRYLTSVINYNDFFKLNTEITNFFNNINIPGLKKYAGIDKIIADIIDNGYDDTDVERLRSYFNRIGVTTQDLGADSYSFGNSLNAGNAVANEDIKSDWDNYPCVTKIGTNPVTTKDGSIWSYTINGVIYYFNGMKKLPNGKFAAYDCNSPEFVTKKVQACPVGDVNKVKEFQDWLDKNVPNWHKKYSEGLKKDVNKGYGVCGPNTIRNWNIQSYKDSFTKGVDLTNVNQTNTSSGNSSFVDTTDFGTVKGEES